MLMLINKLNVDYYLLNIDIDNQFRDLCYLLRSKHLCY